MCSSSFILRSGNSKDYFHSQVNVKNGGADTPSSSELTTLPGMYNGYKWLDIWTDSPDGFVVAGPKVVSFADNSSPDPAPAPSGSSYGGPSSSGSSHGRPSSTVSRPSSTSTPADPTSTGVCRTMRKRSNKRSLPALHIHRRSIRH